MSGHVISWKLDIKRVLWNKFHIWNETNGAGDQIYFKKWKKILSLLCSDFKLRLQKRSVSQPKSLVKELDGKWIDNIKEK